MRILVTRADDRAGATAERLRAQGHAVLVVPMTRIVPVDASVPRGPFAGIIVTSARALQLLKSDDLNHLLPLTLYAVGQETARIARMRRFANVVVAGGNSRSLVPLIIGRPQHGLPLLYLAGQDRKPQLEEALAGAGYSVVAAVIYEAVEVKALSKDQIAALAQDQMEAVLHYSRRSAEIYCRLMKSSGLEALVMAPKHFCISADTAKPLQAMGAPDVTIAPKPEEACLLERL
jgi:uroporphyrinogen-III synthase